MTTLQPFQGWHKELPDIASLQLEEIQTKGLQTSRHHCDSDYALLITFNQPSLLPLEGFEKVSIKRISPGASVNVPQCLT